MDNQGIRLKKGQDTTICLKDTDATVFEYRHGEVYTIAPVAPSDEIKVQLHVQLEDRPYFDDNNRGTNFEIHLPYDFAPVDFKVPPKKPYRFFLEGLSGMEVIAVKRIQ